MEARRADRYYRSRQLLILADTGGSNSCRTGAWETEVQTRFCNSFGFTVTVAHYRTGASKWNPIEHRLFSEISKNWAEPLDSYPKVLNFIRNGCTRSGLAVSAYLARTDYRTGNSPDPDEVRRLCIERHATLAPVLKGTLTRSDCAYEEMFEGDQG